MGRGDGIGLFVKGRVVSLAFFLDEMARRSPRGTVKNFRDDSASLADNRFFADHVHLNAAGTAALHRIMLESGFFGPWQSPKAPGNQQ